METVSPGESQAQLHAPHRCQDTEDQAGVGIVSRIIRVLPVGAVEQVKCFHADLESGLLLCQRSLEVELLPQRPVRRGEPIRRNRLRSPMLDALKAKIPVDVLGILTDSETWAGKVHPKEALNQYRERTGTPANLIVVAMVSNGFSIADPNDGGMLDVVGFDTAVPQIMADFAT